MVDMANGPIVLSQTAMNPVVLPWWLIILCILFLLNVTATGEVENGVEEDFSLSMETNDLKSASTPMSTATMMPSPILLWRFKVSLFE